MKTTKSPASQADCHPNTDDMPRTIKGTVSFRPSPAARAALEAALSMTDKGVSELVNEAIEQHGIALVEEAQAEAKKKNELMDRIKKMSR